MDNTYASLVVLLGWVEYKINMAEYKWINFARSQESTFLRQPSLMIDLVPFCYAVHILYIILCQSPKYENGF